MTHTKEWLRKWRMPKIVHGRPTKYGWVVLHPSGLHLGRYVDIGAFSLIQAEGKVTIMDCAELGSHVSVYSVSTIDNTRGPVSIGRFARIGSHSVILPGVSIGHGAIVGACSLVKNDVPENAVAFGIPAKVRKANRKVR